MAHGQQHYECIKLDGTCYYHVKLKTHSKCRFHVYVCVCVCVYIYIHTMQRLNLPGHETVKRTRLSCPSTATMTLSSD